jgi:hypothetical protein
MANQPWLDEVRTRLADQALPPTYIKRFVEELSDHLEDVTEETMGPEIDAYSRLGEPKQVAEAAVVAYRRRSFLGRHPTAAFLVFGVSPVVSLLGLFILAYYSVYLFFIANDQLGGNINLRRFEPAASVVMPYVLSLCTIAIPSVLASIFYCKLINRFGIGKKWILLSCVVLAVVAAIPCCSVKLSDLPGESALMWGAWNPESLGQLSQSIVWVCRPLQLLQFLVPLATGWWFLRRNSDRRQLQLAS